MLLCFELSMPNVDSWNGKWTGERNYYAKVISLGHSKQNREKADQILSKRYFRYNFSDGWGAGINVKEVNAREAAKIRRKSDGFCSYDWMIKSIIDIQRIETPQ